MSILLAAAPAVPSPPASAPSPEAATGDYLGLLLFTILALALGKYLRVFDRKSVVGPTRLPPGVSLLSFVFVLCVGGFVWISAQGVYVAYRQGEVARATGVDIRSVKLEAVLTPKDYAILSTIPPLLGFAALVIGDRMLRRGVLRALGLDPRDAGRGFLKGVVAFLIIGPAVLWTLNVSEAVFRRIHYEHPREHVLLKSLGDAENGTAAVMLLLGATVMAPFFEELLFRGHLQTLLREFLARYFPRRPDAAPVPVIPLPDASGAAAASPGQPMPPLIPPLPPLPPLDYAPPAVARPPSPPSPAAWHGWVAILLTSLLFAMFHEAWSRPAIFVLALGLGYVYERTGKLWPSITVHLLFNALNTVEYWFLMRGH